MAPTPPRRPNSTNISLPYEQNKDVLDMPNVASAVTVEIKRLELALINDITTALDFDYQSFDSIDYMPDAFQGDGAVPGSDAYKVEFRNVIDEIKRKLSFGVPNTASYNYVEYRKFFSIGYNSGIGGNGDPIIKFILPINDNNIDDLDIFEKTIKKENSGDSATVED